MISPLCGKIQLMQNQSQLVFVQPPPNFNPKVEVAACFIHVEDQVLFLKRQPHKTEGDMWGIPGGRLEKGESAQEAVIREIQEETSLELSSPLIKSFGKVYIRYTHVDFIYHMFEYRLKEFPAQIKIDPIEHTEYR